MAYCEASVEIMNGILLLGSERIVGSRSTYLKVGKCVERILSWTFPVWFGPLFQHGREMLCSDGEFGD